MARRNGEGTREWVKAITPIVIALLTALGAWQATTLKNAARANCEAINDLRSQLREVILLAPADDRNPEASQEFVDRSLRLLELRDCNALVD